MPTWSPTVGGQGDACPGADLTGLALHFGTGAAAVFDTQLAAGFAGLGGSLSLERMLDQTLGVRLKHAEGFTDWSKRPLTATQVAYAGDDVRHLLAAMDALLERLRSQGRDRWADEEMERRTGRGAAGAGSRSGLAPRGGRGKLRGEQLVAWSRPPPGASARRGGVTSPPAG